MYMYAYCVHNFTAACFWLRHADLKAKIDILKHSMVKQEQCLSDKERELARRVQAAREEEWNKLHAVEADKSVTAAAAAAAAAVAAA